MNFIDRDIEHYCTKNSSSPSALCRELEEYTYAHAKLPQMLVGPLTASLLTTLIRLSGAKTVLEIGTFTGYSALAMAEALPKEGRLITLDINSKTTETAGGFWKRSPHGDKIRSIVGPAKESLEALPGPFDFVFIDADKKNYPLYLELSLQRLGERGLIVVDNVLWEGKVLERAKALDCGDEETLGILALTERVRKDSKLQATFLPVRDGLFLIQKKIF
ncbi:MAG: class I SAM-dependent methyltransferase, partial [Bacteriovoracales bacterium]|nr:class I SAM-dependent methyltransferase [Bacteriovoracales bacterium]